MHNRRTHTALAFLLFLGLSLIQTYPLVQTPGSGVIGGADALLTTWIMDWDVKKLASGEVGSLFDANIFWPNHRTLTYSENLLPQSLLAAPIIGLTGNPLLAQNILVLLAMAATGLAMYWYVLVLTGAPSSALLAGLVFAFCPFMFDQIGHLQVISAAGIPLALLFFYRLIKTGRWRYVALIALSLALQMLANCYYAVYLAYFFPLVVGYHVVTAAVRRRLSLRLLLQLGVCGVVVFVLVFPVIAQYIIMQHELGFKRLPTVEADLGSYSSVSNQNLLYGFLYSDEEHGRRLFPGLVPVMLLGCCFLCRPRREGNQGEEDGEQTTPSPEGRPEGEAVVAGSRDRLYAVLHGATLIAVTIDCLLVLGLDASGRSPKSLLLNNMTPAIAVAVLATTLRAVVDRRFRDRLLQPLDTAQGWRMLHLLLLLLTVSLTFGFKGPYALLFKYLPGFQAMRAIPRTHVLSMLSLAVLAGFGLQRLLGATRRPHLRTAIAVLAPGLVVLEYLSCPTFVARDFSLDRPPAVYRWLQQQPGNEPVVELPFWSRASEGGRRRQAKEMLYSTLHWRPLVEGYSGLVPPSQAVLINRWRAHDYDQFFRDVHSVGVRYVIFDRSELEQGQMESLQRSLRHWADAEKPVYSDERHEVWELPPPWEQVSIPACECDEPIPRADRAIEPGNGSWSVQQANSRRTDVTVTLPSAEWVCGLAVFPGGPASDLPDPLRASLKLSPDGQTWLRRKREQRVFRPLLGFYLPGASAGFQLRFAGARIKAARVTVVHAPGEPLVPERVLVMRCAAGEQAPLSGQLVRLSVCKDGGRQRWVSP